MPELPEVETIRRGLNQKICHKRIIACEVRKLKMVRGSVARLKNALLGRSFTKVERRAKLLIFDIVRADMFLLVHLKMTGQLVYVSGRTRTTGGHPWPRCGEKMPHKHTHVIFTFSDRSKLFFNDLRQFGYLQLVSRVQLNKIKSAYGLEPLTPQFTEANFLRVLDQRAARLKSVLLDQHLFAGIGNIYADEICHAARVRPLRRVPSLTLKERHALYRACQRIMKAAVAARGTTVSDFIDVAGHAGGYARYLKVYGRTGKPCLTCRRGMIKRTKLGSRGTYYCPACQR